MTRVTMAPGCHITTPHPSGLASLGAVTLSGGQSAYVPARRAQDLWKARLILHPTSGELPPPPRAAQEGPMIGFNGGPMKPLTDGFSNQPTWAATAEPPRSTPDPTEAPPWHPGGDVHQLRAGRRDPLDLTGVCAPIQDAFGNPWPPA